MEWGSRRGEPTAGLRSPEVDAVFAPDGIGGDRHLTLGACLSNDQSVEGVFVKAGEASRLDDMRIVDHQQRSTGVKTLIAEGGGVNRELPQAVFDRHFPNAGHGNQASRCRHELARLLSQPRIAQQSSRHDLGVEQQFHASSKSLPTSASACSPKAASTSANFPDKAPQWRKPGEATHGTSRTWAWPWLAMMTSSPETAAFRRVVRSG
ncbi:hypothetical protein [Thiocapsa rosea]|nr:hypothetical protein [Thiocapsa rosea]